MSRIGLVAAATAGELQQLQFNFQPEHVLQLITALLLGAAGQKFETAKARGVHYLAGIDQPGASRLYVPDFHRGALIDRIARMLERQEQKGARIPVDDLARDFQAQNAASIVIDNVKRTGLAADTHRLLFAADAPVNARALLAATRDSKLGSGLASVESAAGNIPAAPTRGLAQHLQAIANVTIDSGPHGMTVSEWVRKHRPVAIEFPALDLHAGRMARSDRFTTSSYSDSAELGYGFILVSDQGRFGYHVLSPMLFWMKKHDGEAPTTWRVEIKRESFIRNMGAGLALDEAVRMRSRFGFPQLGGCSQCGALYAEGRDARKRPDLQRRCGCADVGAADQLRAT